MTYTDGWAIWEPEPTMGMRLAIMKFKADIELNETGAGREYWVDVMEVKSLKSKVECTTIDNYGKVDVQEYPTLFTGGSPDPGIFSMKVTTKGGKVATYKVHKVDNKKNRTIFIIRNQDRPLNIGILNNVTIEIYSRIEKPFEKSPLFYNANYDAQLRILQYPKGGILFNVNDKKPIYVTGEDEHGNKQQMIAKVKSVTINDDKSVNLKLSNKTLKAKGKAAKKAVKGFDSGEYKNMKIETWSGSESESVIPSLLEYSGKLKNLKEDLATLEFEKTSERVMTFNDETQTVESVSQKKYFKDLKEKLEQSSDLNIICKPSNFKYAIHGKLHEITLKNDDVWEMEVEIFCDIYWCERWGDLCCTCPPSPLSLSFQGVC